MDGPLDPLEGLWDGLLSRVPEQVRAVFATLDPAEKQAVLVHLKHMAREPGWQPEQRASAQAALEALEH